MKKIVLALMCLLPHCAPAQGILDPAEDTTHMYILTEEDVVRLVDDIGDINERAVGFKYLLHVDHLPIKVGPGWVVVKDSARHRTYAIGNLKDDPTACLVYTSGDSLVLFYTMRAPYADMPVIHRKTTVKHKVVEEKADRSVFVAYRDIAGYMAGQFRYYVK